MENGSRIIRIPRALWKLHGRQTYLLDLLLTYLLAVTVALVNLTFSGSLPAWKTLLLVVLSLDIGGGMVSNFTSGTIEYYSRSSFSPYAFVWFHLLQASVLLTVYWDFGMEIGSISLLAMLFSSLVIRVSNVAFKQQVSAFLFALFAMAVLSVSGLPAPASILLISLGFKLIVGFSAHWNGGQKG